MATYAVTAGASEATIQAVLDGLVAGDVVTFEAGATFAGQWTLPSVGTAGNPYILQSAGYGTAGWPASGTRVNPTSHQALMAHLKADQYGNDGEGPFTGLTAGGAVVIRGLYFTTDIPSGNPYWSMKLGSSTETVTANLPTVTLQHNIVDLTDLINSGAGIRVDANACTIRDNYILGREANDGESKSILVTNGHGPYTVENNYLANSAIGMLWGGAVPAIPGADACSALGQSVSFNHFYKNPSTAGNIKNHLEFKVAANVVVEGNVFENSWFGAQPSAMLISGIDDTDKAGRRLDTITIRYNKWIRCHAMLDVTKYNTATTTLYDIVVHDNLGDRVSIDARDDSAATTGCFRVGGVTDLLLYHNTVIGGLSGRKLGSVAVVGLDETNGTLPGLEIRDNLFCEGGTDAHQITKTGSGGGTTAMTAMAGVGNYVLAKNFIVQPSAAAIYPDDYRVNAQTDLDALINTGTYRVLTPASYLGTDGRVSGADLDAVAAYTLGVAEGAPAFVPVASRPLLGLGVL